MPDLPAELAAKRDRLLELLRGYGSCAVAFSGGLDSTVLAKAAQQPRPVDFFRASENQMRDVRPIIALTFHDERLGPDSFLHGTQQSVDSKHLAAGGESLLVLASLHFLFNTCVCPHACEHGKKEEKERGQASPPRLFPR